MRIGEKIGVFSTPEVETVRPTPIVVPAVSPIEVEAPEKELVEVEIETKKEVSK